MDIAGAVIGTVIKVTDAVTASVISDAAALACANGFGVSAIEAEFSDAAALACATSFSTTSFR
jgi:hypothetical protein